MLICVTNRKLCRDDFLKQINLIAKGKPKGIMLREKDLNLCQYENLALKVKSICDTHQVPLIINEKIEIAAKMKIPYIHLSMADLRIYKKELHQFTHIGASIHSTSEAKEAEKLGATYLVAGHIFATDCKKGIPPKGISFLKEVCNSVVIPVFAIGGITKTKVKAVKDAGAAGVCIMSEAMTCLNPLDLAESFNF
ncbi:thiamine phosphate synthase [Clostridium sp. CX1]|uniref:Thiamine phosphate synthase n=1 Tax=Clostridium tanneri TaxID=3037988 RepID=A0ABU4JTV4_9CLOT|nr:MULTISPECIES: thiamine phosphate synthase [unclassified Clostridium]MCT8975658.1 thiamine phosphate synthase [Clostridium sp. CX1]MDW8801537.1 thiamine phosphate synthase [Clostridium sp. A1-XYC3]